MKWKVQLNRLDDLTRRIVLKINLSFKVILPIFSKTCPTFVLLIKKISSWITCGPLKILKKLKRVVSGDGMPSLNFEVTVLYSLILGFILIFFSGVLYAILFRGVYSELDQELEFKAGNISQSIRAYVEVRGKTPESLLFAVEKTITNEGKRLNRWWFTGFERKWLKRIDEMDLSQNFINFIGPDAKYTIGSKNLTLDLSKIFLKDLDLTQNDAITFKSIPYKERNIRVINLPFKYDGKLNYIIQVGVYQKPLMDLVFDWLNSIMISIPLILILTSFIGRLLVKKILRPVHQIAATARNISHEDLSARVKVDKPYIEMNYLVDDFNDMIGRLGRAFEHVEEFSSHVAHELKTPLTIIKGETELALFEDRSKEEYKNAMKVSLEEVDKMLTIIEDLLLLTKLNYQPEIFHFEQFEFAGYFNEIIEQSAILARSKEIKITAEITNETMPIKADKIHLRRLFFNLLDNAIKFTPQGGSVRVTVKKDKGCVVISIADSGPGIPKEDIPKIFNRFYRSASKEKGCGLGLSIAQLIAEIHKGKISANSRLHQGTTIKVALPTE